MGKNNTMINYVWKHLPYAVYMDTNALRSAGLSLNKQWISELLSITNENGISVCIADLVLKEWCEHIFETLKSNHQKMFSAINLLKDYNVQVPSIESHKFILPSKSELAETVRQKLINTGFTIIKNWDGALSQLINEAIDNYPPFEHGGKGLCDAVILESYIKHAKENFDTARVLVISDDSAVKRSENRFEKHGIAVEFTGESEIVEKLKSLLKNEVATFIEEKNSHLEKNVLTHESEILEYINKSNIEITDWMLEGPFAKEEDKIYGTIESILSVRPIKISKVVGGVPNYGKEMPKERYPIQIFVEIEIDIIVRYYGFGLLRHVRAVVQPDMIDKDSPVHLDEGTRYEPLRTTKTAKRSITVFATIDAEKEKKNIFDDFKIEKII